MKRRIGPQQAEDKAVLDLAWRVHDTAAASIAKADTKAGFVATVNTALLAGVLTLTHPDRLGPVAGFLVSLGIAFMAAAILFAVAVAVPILRARNAKHATAGDFLYFGAVRHSSPNVLAERLEDEDPLRGVCNQAITLSRLSWLKHRLVQLSLLATIVGSNLVGWTFLFAGGAS